MAFTEFLGAWKCHRWCEIFHIQTYPAKTPCTEITYLGATLRDTRGRNADRVTTLQYKRHHASSSFLYKVPEMSELRRNSFLEQTDLVAVLGNGPNSLIFETCNLGELLSVAADFGMTNRKIDVGRRCSLKLQGLESRLHPHPTG